MDEKQWEREARELFVTDRKCPEESIYWGPFLNGYIAAKRLELEGKIEGLEKHPKLELAFQHQRFSGIVVNDEFIDSGEVVDYIIKLEGQLKEKNKKIEELELRIVYLELPAHT